MNLGGTVAEWSKALRVREEINRNQKIPGSTPGPGNLKKLAEWLVLTWRATKEHEVWHLIE